MRGTMGPQEVSKLQKCLSRWVLRNGRRGGGIYKGVDGMEEGVGVEGEMKKLNVGILFCSLNTSLGVLT